MVKLRMARMRRPQTRSPRLQAAARRNLYRAHVMRIGMRGMRYIHPRLPKHLRILAR